MKITLITALLAAAVAAPAVAGEPPPSLKRMLPQFSKDPPGAYRKCWQVDGIYPDGHHAPGVICKRIVPSPQDGRG